MTIHKLKSLVLKPILKCNGRCSFCSNRRDLYKTLRKKTVMGIDKWQRIILEAISLGLKSVHISGGEPMLYEHLLELVTFCKEQGLFVNINTNGYYLENEHIQNLVSAGLDSCTISIYSHLPSVHDRMKQINGAHSRAIKAIAILQTTPIRLNIQTVLASQNMHDFAHYLGWIRQFNINKLFISYIEGGDSSSLPGEQDICRFVQHVIPQCKSILLDSHWESRSLLIEGLNSLRGLFQFNGIRFKDLSLGAYNLPYFKGCGVSCFLGIILANGDILSCNGVEYHGSPIIGNLLNSSFAEMWNSEAWERVRRQGAGWCQYCPMNRHAKLRFREGGISFYHPTANLSTS